MTESISNKTFSHRMKINKSKKDIQYESIDDDLKHSIWNVLFMHYLDIGEIPSSVIVQNNRTLKIFCENILYGFFKVPGDRIINGYLSNAIEGIRELYYELNWNEIYDLVEFLANIKNLDEVRHINKKDFSSFIESCNNVFERENSGYRFVNNKISKIE